METHATRALREQSRVLLLASPTEIERSGLCFDTLSTATPAQQHALTIAYKRRPRDIVEGWRDHNDALPASLAIICPESQATPDETLPEGVHETHVAAGDLTGVGIAVSRYLDRWADDDAPITACLDSLTVLLQYTETDRVFRFLHTLTGRFMAAGASAHVHLDPRAHDDQTIATLTTLFDAVVERDGDEWLVRQS
ncbi:DUF835 domain-containing protein [Halorientalis brevis]|uniref:DUF835 domain-containing protein n=1 Tax=Halorientalis brevis TaxID=1126241 RepID=A0ABD6CA03_9EURY|nr:DUF835 domain-containing protein [Halorientalis brevis]